MAGQQPPLGSVTGSATDSGLLPVRTEKDLGVYLRMPINAVTQTGSALSGTEKRRIGRNDMLKYIISDLLATLRYLPYGIIAGLFAVVVLHNYNRGRVKHGKATASLPAVSCLVMYVAIMLVITYFSRESGSRIGMDLELFSTWGINQRNNAYVVENVLLFIPYGFILAWADARQRNFLRNFLTGALTSLAIECMQLITERGYFQIDDILTNILGTVLGFLCYWLLYGLGRLLGTGGTR